MRYVHLKKDRAMFIRETPIPSSERILHKDYDRKDSVAKKNLVVSLKGLGAKTNWLAVNRKLPTQSMT
jgi:hypothetical protein